MYCSKCAINEPSKVRIFNIIKPIINSNLNIYDMYKKINSIDIPFEQWLEYNEDGYNVFQWYAWFISTNYKKNINLKPYIYLFFTVIFKKFNKNQVLQVINQGTSFDETHNLLYHLVHYCENPNDIYYKKLYKLIIANGAQELTEEQIINIKTINTVEELIPENLKIYINDITNKYKYIETLIIEKLNSSYKDYQFEKCCGCCEIISFVKEIPKIIIFAKTNNHYILLNMIWFAYYQRKLVNKLFDKYYQIVDSKKDLNKIHNRHNHILEVYKENLIY